MQIEEKKKKLKKEGKDQRIEEDDPAIYKRAISNLTMKLFADLERKRKQLEEREMQERKRQREDEIEEEENTKLQKEWNKNYEVILKNLNIFNIIFQATSLNF